MITNTKEKMKHIPINLFLSVGNFGITYIILTFIQNNNVVSFLFALFIYINSVGTNSKLDYLDEQIDYLKKTSN